MPIPLFALAVAAFGIGTTEFIIMGLLPEVAADLGVSIPAAGWLVTGYALGVAIGAPIMALATAHLPRKAALLGLMAIFILGNLLCAMAGSYAMLMVARVITALCHGAFFGIGAVVAAGLVAENRRASAVALMFTGLTLANVLGVPAGTALGHAFGWRSSFWAVCSIGIVALAGITWLLPRNRNEAKIDLLREFAVLREGPVWQALSMTILTWASIFTLFTYIAPILGEVTQVSPSGVSWTLLLIGIGLTIGNLIGGRLADWHLKPALAGILVAMLLIEIVFAWTSRSVLAAEITLFLWGAAAFATVPALQINVVAVGGSAPNLVSTLNIGAFNAGNAFGAWVGGTVIAQGAALTAVPLAAAGLAAAALLLTGLSMSRRLALAQPA